ncbi:hypothetical protein NE237_027437 [Protea cynaroides]|uniref:Uncharacterized protein n=1 Tax=Protea cynaroides TaxID=273540 RepID=A0A9Q0GQH4_9MAGN|nr:hypothetical protein NE237_027437 [Protea cynaroides]
MELKFNTQPTHIACQSISEIKMAEVPDVDLSHLGVTEYGNFSLEVIDPVSDDLELPVYKQSYYLKITVFKMAKLPTLVWFFMMLVLCLSQFGYTHTSRWTTSIQEKTIEGGVFNVVRINRQPFLIVFAQDSHNPGKYKLSKKGI